MEASAETNPVLEARRKRLAHNRDYLKSLGLAEPAPSAVVEPAPRKSRPMKKRGSPPLPSRRSARISVETAEFASLPDSESSDSSENVQPEKRRPSRPRRQPVYLEAPPHAQVVLKRPTHMSDRLKSTKKVDARVEKMSDEWIGKLFEPEDGGFKAYVMDSVAEEPVSFSKYSGIQ